MPESCYASVSLSPSLDRPVVARKFNDDDDDDGKKSRSFVKRLSSPERWELQQLANSGVLKITEMPNFDPEVGVMNLVDEAIEEIEIELNPDEPAFLAGQTQNSITLSPISVVKNPDGSMQVGRHRTLL